MRSVLHNLCDRMAGRWVRDDGAQMVEFAVTLPLLVVFVVGIFDFSGAFTLKQKLTNVARDAARVAAADPASDVNSSAVPASVTDAYQVVTNYFIANKINACGLTATAAYTAPATWTYSANANGCPAPGLTIVINRGYYFPQSLSVQPANAGCTAQALGGQTAEIGTCVTINYPYQWKFGRVAGLLGASSTVPSTITSTAVAMNEN